MNYIDLGDILNRVNVLREDIRMINKLIDEEYYEHHKVAELEKMISDKKKELIELSQCSFHVRLGDLLREISSLTGISINDFSVKLSTNVIFIGNDVEKMTKVFRDSGDKHSIKFELTYGDKIKFVKYFPFGDTTLQTSGDLIRNHCSLVTRMSLNNEIKEWVIDKDIENVILNFDLSFLETENSELWYPADLFVSVVKNCVNKENNVSKSCMRK